ncbi:MAG: type I DNA topoisomerase [bacterium]|nr:type I DNA topoisomerase [bacterium]MYB10507.1 type I DNA topoisomerase [Acidimicrobiia bacterium]MYG59311.1 type I DNA topoisomerase [Acidimicrobiia bacterium]MYJ32430.1 type I DNA topoisomerase [Acidimicrobiia bacterium]
MPNALVIVESPAKAKTIAGYLGSGYVVESSIGHIRDLPSNAGEVPEAYRGESWSRLGIDVDNDFKPLYVVPSDKKSQIRKLKQLLKESDELYLATDEDREGEAIAWHLLEVLSPKAEVNVKRMVFHEITPSAIRSAIESPRDLDRRLVDAQEARRLLDRLYGYEVSPVLWKKVLPRLSAGRVQSVATRIVVERERERMAFTAADYWSLSAVFRVLGDLSPGDPSTFTASLTAVDGAKVAVGKDFASDGQLRSPDAVHLNEEAARSLARGLSEAEISVRGVEVKPYRRRPAAPFMTSTLQQEAGRKLRLSAAMAMRAAQSLYEKGYITYMRTDSTTLSEAALQAARAAVSERFGASYLPDEARRYAKKVKNAQEAHEAIRPSGDQFRTPEEVRAEVPQMEAQVYELIWQRTVASQMTDTVGETVHVDLGGTTADGRDAAFSAAGTVITHEGFRRVYTEGTDEEADQEEAERRMPSLAAGDPLAIDELSPSGHTTQPPARYTEASLVRRLEELGVGRPSTYAAIMNTIVDRGYVWKKGAALVPSFTAFSVVTLLEQHFPNLVDYAFTARMEDDLDGIASGDREAIPWLSRFYFGPADNEPDDDSAHGVAKYGLRTAVSDRLGDIDARAVNSIPIGADENGEPVVVRVGRYGPYVQRGEDRASLPDDLPPDELTLDRALSFISAPSDDRTLGDDPETGLPVVVRSGRFGPYVQIGEEAEDGGEKPKRASLLAGMQPETITLDDALKVLSLPRVVGTDPADGTEVVVQNGRYGPYVTKGKENRSLDSEDQLFTITLEQCLELLAQPRRRRGQTAKPPLRDLGLDPATEKPMLVKDGRYGPYVTDGEVNASLGKADSVETLTVERASELLQRRRDRIAAGGGKPKARGKSTAKKKTPAKSGAAKKKSPPRSGS